MAEIVPFSLESLLLCGYVVFFILMNILGLLISSFYKKKFNQPSPKIGFFLAIVFALVFIVVIQMPSKTIVFIQLISTLLLISSATASIVSTLFLFLTMRKVRK
jgi:polyferredoxin